MSRYSNVGVWCVLGRWRRLVIFLSSVRLLQLFGRIFRWVGQPEPLSQSIFGVSELFQGLGQGKQHSLGFISILKLVA